MVAAVNRWKASLSAEAYAASPWTALAQLNPAVAARFGQLCGLETQKTYKETLQRLSNTPPANVRGWLFSNPLLLVSIGPLYPVCTSSFGWGPFPLLLCC